jgi:surfeit locus 1 family protein
VPRRLIAFVALAVVLAALFIRLGFWQLSRLEDRRAFNAARARPLAEAEIPFERLTDASPYRRVRLRGAPDYAQEIALSGRSRNGSPGVHVLTPFRRADSDTAVLVNRGWVYAADAATADLTRFRETVDELSGFTDTIPAGAAFTDPNRPRVVRRLTRGAIEALVPYPVHPVMIVMQDSAGPAAPPRLPLPSLSDGPHLGYAIQWFAFALTALVGAGIVGYRTRKPRSAGATAARDR